jgi:hypothetical protein
MRFNSKQRKGFFSLSKCLHSFCSPSSCLSDGYHNALSPQSFSINQTRYSTAEIIKYLRKSVNQSKILLYELHVSEQHGMKSIIFWDVMLCGPPYVCQHFGGMCYLHPQGCYAVWSHRCSSTFWRNVLSPFFELTSQASSKPL